MKHNPKKNLHSNNSTNNKIFLKRKNGILYLKITFLSQLTEYNAD